MKILTVRYNKKVMKCFKAKARETDNEILGWLIGRKYVRRNMIFRILYIPKSIAVETG